jgi:hypothetical protein
VSENESAFAGPFCQKRGIKLAVLRPISDTADETLPAVVKTAVNPDGSSNLQVVFDAIAKDPSLAFQLGKISADYSRCLMAIERAVWRLGGGFAIA